MIIPQDQLQPQTLDALIEEFITRDGAVHGHHDTSLEAMKAAVLNQLHRGLVVIMFDEQDQTCTIVERRSLL